MSAEIADADPQFPRSGLYVATLSVVRSLSHQVEGGEVASTFPYGDHAWHFTTERGQDWIAVVLPKGNADIARLREAGIRPRKWVADEEEKYAIHVLRSSTPQAADLFLTLPWLLEAQVRVLLQSTAKFDPSPDRQTEARRALDDPEAFAGMVTFWRGRLLDDRAEMLLAARGSV